MNHPLSIRLATVEDAPGIGAMHVQSWREAYAGLLPQALLEALSVEERVDRWKKNLGAKPDSRRNWVSLAGDRITGFVSAGPSRDKDTDAATTGEIFGIYLLKEFWGAGVGREMMRIGISYLAALPSREVILWVLSNNARTRKFYETAGFAPDGSEKSEVRWGCKTHEVRYRAPMDRLLSRLETTMFDRFSHVMMYVKDIKRALDWYKSKLGFVENFASEHFASLRHDGMKCRLDLHPTEANSKDVGFGPLPYFASRNFDKALAELKKKGVKTGEPRSEGGSPRFVSFWDSEGNALGLEELRG
ncbi:MAG: GNAT family N-acetyltransferase [Planctomycetes bacterium]|nr:GNAT family N-acetyltransferase [Planctomycetota bacterium]